MKKVVKKIPQKKLPNAYIEGSGTVQNEKITDTLQNNYMPYAMSVIISRALPEIDGFKPSHRKLLYTMYKMSLLNGARTKSANVVGQTMRLNPHGDSAIYETMVRMSRGNETLLHPFVDSKGNFGKFYSRDMAYAASRYTEVKLAPICECLFSDIDKETVQFIPNYDNSTTEPKLLPVNFPTVLVNSNIGIAVSMASAICPFNLQEVCETTIELIKNPNHDIISTLKGPDFPGGGFLLYDENEIRKIYNTGRGSVKVRAKYEYNKTDNCIEITQIPYSTTIEAITEKVIDLIKQGKIREISYIRDETDLSGLRIAIDLKRGTDPNALMQKLYRMTPLQDNYSCNFNVLVGGTPRVMGVGEIISEWLVFRRDCVQRRLKYELRKKQEILHKLKGLEAILVDIDKAIKIVRETEKESEVVPNLMTGFSITEIQAEYVAEIKLRHLNREYILKHIKNISELELEIEDIQNILGESKKIDGLIVKELKDVIKKYGKPRNTLIIFAEDVTQETVVDDTPDYPVHLFLTKSGYFKKVTPQSLRMSGGHKLKEGDSISVQVEATNKTELIFFTDKIQAYKSRAAEFDDTKISVMGDYIPVKLGFEENENVIAMISTTDYKGFLVFVYENGKVSKVPLSAYETKLNRKKLVNAYGNKSAVVKIFYLSESDSVIANVDNAIANGESSGKAAKDIEILIRTTNNRIVVFDTEKIPEKSTKSTIGVQVITIKAKAKVEYATDVFDEFFLKYRAKKIPLTGGIYKGEQLSLT
ncbi:MAG: topoisomerase IV [Ruminococcus sp.]|jgi:DNA gyrase subunit A|nr:topoisomerase IV [Ruminococcus sp.]